MGEDEEWPHPSGLLLNGLLPNETASLIRVIDGARWTKAEERTAELIACIQPNQPSEDRRGAVADYVQGLITRCFPCQVFTFGSVPLKTYLPDGDIDLTAFSKNIALKDTWGIQVRDILASEEKNENAEFRVKEVQYIQAEVKIVKCLVENIVVDISFNQLGGLCTLCFLEEVDNLINQNHLFKRSIILIKAWCYYESRILGAHHGLISTYALETLVLYIFHIFNNSFAGPLEVLYRFLEFFSNFDWENFCVSLWGPVPISSLPDINAEPPRKDGGELLLSKLFLQACNSVYAVVPAMQDNQGQPFLSKHFNVIDPLRLNNNLGRSVSKGNFYRIRSAFAFGAKRLARLLDCSEECISIELNQFFLNTWERHGSGIRPDAPASDFQPLQPLKPDDDDAVNNLTPLTNKESSEEAPPPNHVVEVESRPLSSQRASYPLESTSKCNDAYAVPSGQSKKSIGKSSTSLVQDPPAMDNSNLSLQNDRNQRSLKSDQMVNQLQGKHLFARTRSSPELTDAYCDASSRSMRTKAAESGNGQVPLTKIDNSQRKSLISESVSTQSTVSSSDDPSSGRHSSSHQVLDVAADSTSPPNSFVDDSVTSSASEDHASVIGAQGMHQEEQDLVNMMASSSIHNFGGHIPLPLNLASSHLPLPFSQSVLTSMGYGHRSLAGMVPANFPLMDPHWASNLQFHQGLMSSPFSHYFPGGGVPANSEDLLERGGESFNAEIRHSTVSEYWLERDVASNGGFGPDDQSLEILHPDDRRPSRSASSNFLPSSRVANVGSSLKAQQKLNKEHCMSIRDDCVESFQHQDNKLVEIYSDDRVSSARLSSSSQAGSVRSKTSSESSWDGSSARVSKVAREKRGRKTVGSAAAPSNLQVIKGKSIHEAAPSDTDDGSRDWSTLPTGNEIDERSVTSLSASTIHVGNHHVPSFEGAQTSGSDAVIPMAPMLLGPGSRQKVADNSGAVPFAFYPTGPPVPFFTMLPVYNYGEGDSSEQSSSRVGGGESPAISNSGQNFEPSECQDVPDGSNACNHVRRSSTTESSEDRKSDILHSDFASHWQNLQYGRICQSPRFPAPVVCPPPVVVPPGYQGRFPLDGPGRPFSASANFISQLLSRGQQIVPVSPVHSGQTSPPTVYQRYPDEVPRYRGGTGTYLPNTKASVRERHSSSAKRNSYTYDRGDHADREGNWNAAKSRAAGRSHRSHADKSRFDRLAANENRADRPWGAYRHEQLPSYPVQNGQLRPNSSQGSSPNIAYGMYPGVTSNGPGVPPVVMLYPYDHNSGYFSPSDQLEFGTLGPVGFVGPNDGSQPVDAAQLRGAYEDQRFHRGSAQQSSPDQPSSPHYKRSVAQNYQLKEEDFPPLAFQGLGRVGESIYTGKHYHHQTLVFAPQA